MARRGTGIISVLISGDASPLSKEVDKANGVLDGFAQKFGSGLATLGKAAGAAIIGAGAAFAAYAKGGIEAAIETEAAQERLATILRNTGLATESQIANLRGQAKALEEVGVASASNITVLQSQLATFDLSAATIQKLTPAIIDYVIAEKGAAATADDFQSAANGLAQALQGNFGALSRTGFVLDDTTKDMIANGTQAERAAALVDVLSSTYDGFNEKARDTAAGGLQALKNQFGGVQESIGTALLPALLTITSEVGERLLPAFERFGAWFTENEEGITKFVSDVLDRIITTVGNIITTFREWYEKHGDKVVTSFKNIADPVKEIWTNLGDIVTGIGDLIGNIKGGNEDTDLFAVLLAWIGDSVTRIATFIGYITAEVKLLTDKMNEFSDSDGFKAFREMAQIARDLGITDLFRKGMAGVSPLYSLEAILQERAERREMAETALNRRGVYTGSSASGSGGVNITVTSADPQAVVDAIRRYTRTNGPLGQVVAL
jgi:hypothetical protein